MIFHDQQAARTTKVVYDDHEEKIVPCKLVLRLHESCAQCVRLESSVNLEWQIKKGDIAAHKLEYSRKKLN